MIELQVKVTKNMTHRDLSKLAQAAEKKGHSLYLRKGERAVRAASLLGLSTLALRRGDEISIINFSDGGSEDIAVREIVALV